MESPPPSLPQPVQGSSIIPIWVSNVTKLPEKLSIFGCIDKVFFAENNRQCQLLLSEEACLLSLSM